ncbi:helix-turn-helix domain-containing protein [Streptomyces albus]|uniref:helix-turn-helix domain-containing protein n=1 Tax=Streptomyces albus TaxID=1888 RepID=UPI0036FA746D
MSTSGECVDIAVDEVGQWAEITALALVTTQIKARPGQPFAARLRVMRLGASQLSELSYGPLLSQRTPRLIRQSDPELFQVAVIASGRQRIEQAGNASALRGGEMVLYDSSRPFRSQVENCPGGSMARGVLFQFPKAGLPFSPREMDRLLAVPLNTRRGAGRLLAQFLATAAGEYAACTAFEAARLGTTAIDLVITALGHHLGREDQVPADARRQALYRGITTFIEDHMGDPALSADRIAAAHHISVRSLHRLFQQHGTTVASWIRRQRLERCRRELADARLGSRPIHAIAAKWGFPRPADFTRSFRSAYGITPSDYRDMFLDGVTGTTR